MAEMVLASPGFVLPCSQLETLPWEAVWAPSRFKVVAQTA